MINSDDDFQSQMGDVTPIKTEARVRLKRELADKTAAQIRREAAVTERGRDSNPLADEGVTPLDPWFVLEFKRPGIQNGVYRKLKKGSYAAEARLDMHRMNVQRGRQEIYGFINECHALGLRSVLIVHGKGERSPNSEAVGILKGYVDHWLRELPPVQAFHSAPPNLGGTGAVLVLLAKSEEKKRENRERFMRGRVPYEQGSS
ncbi:DNA endonuclease SmrA [Congregibacter variabilis]|uniref:DNA endonuclease SmrA n=1 Tax=Congregibacter variabilis TaxID=3081200 RepID=A0ABZ0I655_9GAMM|nr:DNA endonuclease SmrA [Congregibacter sp. IMCC43200]